MRRSKLSWLNVSTMRLVGFSWQLQPLQHTQLRKSNLKSHTICSEMDWAGKFHFWAFFVGRNMALGRYFATSRQADRRLWHWRNGRSFATMPVLQAMPWAMPPLTWQMQLKRSWHHCVRDVTRLFVKFEFFRHTRLPLKWNILDTIRTRRCKKIVQKETVVKR